MEQFDPFEQPERSGRVNAVRQPPRRFSNLGRPLSKVLEKLIEKGMLRPMPSQQPLPNANPKLYCKFHQTIGHDTDVCTRLRHEIQDLIDTGKITNPETRKPNTQNNPLPNYRNTPPPDAPIHLISTGLMEEQVLNSFVDIDAEPPMTEPESLPQNHQAPELPVWALDMWSSDEEGAEPVDPWEGEEQTENEQVGKVEENKVEDDLPTVQLEKGECSGVKA